METFTNTAGTAGEQDDNPPVLIGTITNPSATITFVDAGGNAIADAGPAERRRGDRSRARSRSRERRSSTPTSPFRPASARPTAVTATVSAGGNAYDTPDLVTDGFIRLSGGAIANNGSLTVQFTTTPNCTSGTYLVSSDPSTNASNPPSGTNQSVSTTGGSLTVAAGLADLSITKTDSPDPVATGGTLTYTIGVSNAGPNDASAVKVVDTLPAGTTFVSATGTNWTCTARHGTVTCNRTGGNLAPGAAPNITIVVTAPVGRRHAHQQRDRLVAERQHARATTRRRRPRRSASTRRRASRCTSVVTGRQRGHRHDLQLHDHVGPGRPVKVDCRGPPAAAPTALRSARAPRRGGTGSSRVHASRRSGDSSRRVDPSQGRCGREQSNTAIAARWTVANVNAAASP